MGGILGTDSFPSRNKRSVLWKMFAITVMGGTRTEELRCVETAPQERRAPGYTSRQFSMKNKQQWFGTSVLRRSKRSPSWTEYRFLVLFSGQILRILAFQLMERRKWGSPGKRKLNSQEKTQKMHHFFPLSFLKGHCASWSGEFTHLHGGP